MPAGSFDLKKIMILTLVYSLMAGKYFSLPAIFFYAFIINRDKYAAQ